MHLLKLNCLNECRNVLNKWIIMVHSFWMNFPWRSSMTWMLFFQTKQIFSDTSSTKITDSHWKHYSSVVASSSALLWPLIKRQAVCSAPNRVAAEQRVGGFQHGVLLHGWEEWMSPQIYWQRRSDKFEWHAGLGQRKFIGAWRSSDLVLPVRSQRESEEDVFSRVGCQNANLWVLAESL